MSSYNGQTVSSAVEEHIASNIGKNGTNASVDENKTLSTIESDEAVFFIVGNEFSVLVLYLKNKLDYTERNATLMYHGFVTLLYFVCIFCGVISDVWWGRFKTILYLSVVYLIGGTIVSISSIPILDISPNMILIIGLVLIAIGGGGIKPCVCVFGGDQFKLPEQAKQLLSYFSVFYLSISTGSLISTTVTPILRADVHCYGDNDCFPLAFGVPGILMLISIVLFLIGKPFYTYVEQSSENMIAQVFNCITNAVQLRIKEGRSPSGKNLLDLSINKYGEQLVNEARVILQIMLLCLPLPLFWTLFDQKGSRWTFQANKMNGDIGFYTIKPDQMQMLNPLLLFILIPLFDTIIYPALSKIGIRRSPQKMTIGMILAALSFLCSAAVQFKIESSPNHSISIFWLIPQYVVITMGDVMFSLVGMTYCYQAAPKKMKSVVSSIWLLTTAFGSLITIVITGIVRFDSEVYDFLLFSGLMFVCALIFMALDSRSVTIKEN